MSGEVSPRPGPHAGEASVPSGSSRGSLRWGLHEEHPECHLVSQVHGGGAAEHKSQLKIA